jgi:hypothetical protein
LVKRLLTLIFGNVKLHMGFYVLFFGHC